MDYLIIFHHFLIFECANHWHSISMTYEIYVYEVFFLFNNELMLELYFMCFVVLKVHAFSRMHARDFFSGERATALSFCRFVLQECIFRKCIFRKNAVSCALRKHSIQMMMCIRWHYMALFHIFIRPAVYCIHTHMYF